MDNLAVMSIAALLAAIALGFVRKVNVGIVSIGFALLLGLAYGIPAKNIVCGALKKSDYGALKGAVCCGGVPVEQGDIICGDENGVVVIKPQEAAGVLERAAAKAKKQAEVRAEVLKTGRPKMF